MTDDSKYANIKDIRPGAKNIHSLFIVLDIGKETFVVSFASKYKNSIKATR